MILSLGTSILVDKDTGQITNRKDDHIDTLKRLLPRGIRKKVETGLDMVQATLDCNREWVDFRSTIRGPEGKNCHRLDIGLTSKPPSLDNVDGIASLAMESRSYLHHKVLYGHSLPYMQPEFSSAAEHIDVVSKRLLASLFYLEHILDIKMPKSCFRTTIYCRLVPHSDGAINILASRPGFRLREVSGSNDEIIHPVRFVHPNRFNETTLSGPVELDISEGEYERTVEVQFPRRGKRWDCIGGF